MSFKGTNISITLQDLLKEVTDIQIAQFYLGIKNIPCIINSPLRIDNNPSLGIYINNKRVKFYDFSTKECGDIFNLLELLWNLKFSTVLGRIYEDISKIKNEVPKITLLSYDKKRTTGSTIDVKVRDWKDYDLEYWESFGITKEWLIKSKTYPISHIIINKDKVLPADKYAYVYVENKDSNISIKIYQPFNKCYKWMSKHNSSVWDLWSLLPKSGEDLIITSSRKDALCIWCNTGIPSCSLQAETFFPKLQVVEELKKRFKNIFILYDNDFTKEFNTGRHFGKDLANLYKLIQIEIPEELESKDSSDLFKNKGKQILINTIFNLIKNNNGITQNHNH